VLPSSSPELVEAPAPTRVREGDSAPDFRALTDEGSEVSLSDFRGKKVVLYFYPKDDTPGCTKEACAFRDGIAQIQERGAVVLGVSIDSVESHRQFKEKYQLNFPLLSDTEKRIVQDYGVWKEKSMYGRTFMGIERTTFVIDEEGRVKRIFPQVDVNIHYDEVLAQL
jgi:peroxiredoxin Q/BCP